MKKTLLLIISVLLCSCAVFAASKIGKQIYPMTMKDGWGVSIKFTAPPSRIVSCAPNTTELLFALDAGGRLVGVTENCNYPLAAEKIEKVGRDKMNMEKIVALKPDLIVMSGSLQGPDIKKFRSYGLRVFVVDPKDVNGLLKSVTLLGAAVNRPHSAYSLTERMERKLDWTSARIAASKKKRPRVFLEVWHKPLITATGKTFLNDMIEKAGGVNIAKWAKGEYPEYSFEKLIKDDPDAIIIPKQNVPTSEAIFNDGKWKKLRAVREGRVLFIDADLLSRPGPRTHFAVEEIASFLYGWDENAEE